MSGLAIIAEGLRKTCGKLVAVDGISFAVGFLVASLAPTARVAYVIGMILYFPNLFLSGTTFPAEMFLPTVWAVGRFVPMTHIVRLLQGLWFGEPLGKHLTEVAVPGGLLVVGAVVSALTFRWE